jgi:hypothetical protein
MICEQRLTLRVNDNDIPKWVVTAHHEPDVPLQDNHAVVVRLLSRGVKFSTSEGYLRDNREHDTDVEVDEYEVELVDMRDEVARLSARGSLREQLSQFDEGAVVAIGFRVSATVIGTTVWEVER